jgi:hypothetical protein
MMDVVFFYCLSVKDCVVFSRNTPAAHFTLNKIVIQDSMGRFTIWKKLAVVSLSLLLLNCLYSIDVPLMHLGINFDHGWGYIYGVNTVFYFLLMTWLFKRYGFSYIVLFTGIAPILIIDCFVYWTGQRLVPMRAPIATLFVLLGAGLAFVFSYRSRWLFLGWLALASGFTALVVWVLLPRAMEFASDRDTPNLIGSIYSSSFKTTSSTPIRLSDTTNSAKALLVEYYFVGCGPCEQKYQLLKELRSLVPEDSLAIVMIHSGSAGTYERFLTHAEKRKMAGITFLYDDEGVHNKLFSDSTVGFPIEVLYPGSGVQPVVTLGYRHQRHLQVYERYLLAPGRLRGQE